MSRRQAYRRPGPVHARRDPAGSSCLAVGGLALALTFVTLALGIAAALIAVRLG